MSQLSFKVFLKTKFLFLWKPNLSLNNDLCTFPRSGTCYNHLILRALHWQFPLPGNTHVLAFPITGSFSLFKRLPSRPQ